MEARTHAIKKTLQNRMVALAVAALLNGVAQAGTQYATGSFTWGTDAIWSATSGSGYTQAWNASGDAIFEGTAGTVGIDTAGVTAHSSGRRRSAATSHWSAPNTSSPIRMACISQPKVTVT